MAHLFRTRVEQWKGVMRRSTARKPKRPHAAGAGYPAFLPTTATNPLHHSPPTTGVGSRAEPLVGARGSVQSVADMQTDCYYRSPVNPANPVVVWTDGTHLFFSPSSGQLAAGRARAAPEATFAPPAEYAAEEIHWDRRRGLSSVGALIVVARKAGAPDLQVGITNRLEQKANLEGMGIQYGARSHVTREGAEFAEVDDTSVPVAFSGAGAAGDIHAVGFSDGFVRYRAPAGDHDLYVSQGEDPEAYLVERATGDITERWASGTIASVVAEPNGVIHLERSVSRRGGAVQTTVTVDLRARPPEPQTAAGYASAEPGYAAVRARLEALDVRIRERGLRLRVSELDTVEQALVLGGNRGLDTLVARRALDGEPAEPILEIEKSVGPDAAYGMGGTGSVPAIYIYESFEPSAGERAAAVRHEMTHVIMDTTDAVRRAGMTAQERADLEGAVRFEARRARWKAEEGLLRKGEYGAGDPTPGPGTTRTWRRVLGGDPELAAIWVELLRRYSFIPDPEGTQELRGASLADESRYGGMREGTGHPADSVSEFVASFVTCATLYRSAFAAAVRDAEAAGNARGGSYVRSLYRRSWDRIDARYVPLESNPFE